MGDNIIEDLGPLKFLVGVWEGGTGDYTAPGDDRGTEKNRYRERMVLDPFKPVKNHEQILCGLRYFTQAWRLGEPDPFHDEVGYWIWDAKAKQVMKCLVIPRGMSIVAGGEAEENSKSFKLTAELGSKTFGICSNPFLDLEFQTVGFELEMVFNGDGGFSYSQNTKIKMKGQPKIFEHRDKNTLKLLKR